MPLPTLPSRYYLDHFFEFIDFLEDHYQALFEKPHSDFIKDFRSLSERAQCTYVRMVNRKGRIFKMSGFQKYTEIDDPDSAFNELQEHGFAATVSDADKLLLLKTLTKTEIRKWLLSHDLVVPSSLSKEDCLLIGKESLQKLEVKSLSGSEDFIVQRRAQELDYLLFLYFGKIQETLSLYTLRDLGIRATNDRNAFRCRFTDLNHAQTEYFLSQKVDEESDLEALLHETLKLKELRLSSKKLRDQLFLRIADLTEENRPDLYVKALTECRTPPAREKLIRFLYKYDQKDEARSLLDQVLKDPWSDEELLFAENFLSLKFNKGKRSSLHKTLNQSREITLSDYYFRRPEEGVRNFYQDRGYTVHFTENHLWNGLFGLLFWDELFETEKASIFNPFERSPRDLVSSEFYNKNQAGIEAKLENLKNLKVTEFELLKTVSRHYGKLNDVFSWSQDLTPLILGFLKGSQQKDPALVLRKMAQRYELYHSGYPDLMIIKDGTPGFIEVKAEGDQLRSKQLSKIRLLKEAGYDAEVLKVKWTADPDQVYVVVDVETTGGTAKFHKIIEIGAVKIQNGKIVDEFQTLINPGRPISRHITELTGITNEMVADAPTFSEVAERFLQFTDRSIFVAHNVRFDYGFIQQEFQRLDLSFVRPQMCTCSGMRKAFPGISSYSLKNLTEHFGIALREHHRAMSDARAAAELLFMLNEHRGL